MTLTLPTLLCTTFAIVKLWEHWSVGKALLQSSWNLVCVLWFACVCWSAKDSVSSLTEDWAPALQTTSSLAFGKQKIMTCCGQEQMQVSEWSSAIKQRAEETSSTVRKQQNQAAVLCPCWFVWVGWQLSMTTLSCWLGHRLVPAHLRLVFLPSNEV